MSFDKPTRKALADTVGECRRLLREDIRYQLQTVYGLQPDGTALPVARLTYLDEPGHEVARALREWQEHLASTEAGTDTEKGKKAFDRLAHETAFTVLNRLAALRMCEERGHIIECVRRGTESDGFVLYERFSGGALGTRGETYQVFLERLFDELAVDLRALFDLQAPQSLVFPREPCLEKVLALLNDPELAHLWKEDETIGWVYQYFNSKEEREKMREDSPAPRNSYELAVRNQFFTPRYVVEFLVDNTLGRIWYEMRKAETGLKDLCCYLVRRPTEVFLTQGEEPPASAEQNENQSQEELLRQPVYIPHRPKKDPRDLKILDPACGSAHFLLYCFDLLETVYEEAWADEQPVCSEATGKTLREDYPDLDLLRRELPGLILRHNLHGIDIDLRACQIAALALWLRAQRSYQRLGLKGADRPKITRSNIVCAEPMPGEEAFLEQFLAGLESKGIGHLVREIFKKMSLAGEAGSLLKIEEEIAGTVAEAKRQWLAGPKAEQGRLFAEDIRPEQMPLGLDFSGITDETFWEKAEERTYSALQAYAEQTENGAGYQRRLFADDTARGFASIELCRGHYDIGLMNPPFGERPVRGDRLLLDAYPVTCNDMYAMFFERTFTLLNSKGKLGAISNRTWFALPTFAGLRTHVLGALGSVECAADLGSFVLEAQVETATAVAGKGTPASYPATWIRLLKTKKKENALREALSVFALGSKHALVYVSSQARFSLMPTAVFGYWMSGDLIAAYRADNSVGAKAAEVRQGTATGDDFRFLRLGWEIPPFKVGDGEIWLPFAKGGEYSPYFDDVHLVLKWESGGRELVAWGKGRPQNTQYFGRVGVTWPRRTTSAFSPRPLPKDCAFGDKGPAAFPHANLTPEVLLAVLASRPARLLLSVRLGAGDDAPGSASKSYEVGLVRDLPFPDLDEHLQTILATASLRCSTIKLLDSLSQDETASLFNFPPVLNRRTEGTLRDLAACAVTEREDRFIEYSELSAQIDERIAEALRFSPQDNLVMSEELEAPLANLHDEHPVSEEIFKKAYMTKAAVPGEILPGGVEAESDVRVATRRKEQSASLRSEECICRLFDMPPRLFAETRRKMSLLRADDIMETAQAVISYAAGAVFGRFDIRAGIANFDFSLPSIYETRPACAPGILVGPDGYPPESGGIVSEEWLRARQYANRLPPQDTLHKLIISDSEYPLTLPWDGVLVDDRGPQGTQHHGNDIVGRVRAVLGLIWKDRAEAIEQEACEILEVKSLREYFRKPALFFADHLKRYSKSRRQAPIYWPLSTASGSYTLWVYYHRLNDDLLYTALNKYVKPKIDEVERQLRQIESDLPTATGREASKLRDAFEDTKVFLEELCELRDELQRVAGLPYKPNLNDGVLITASPLWKLFRLPKWRKDLEECWKKLSAGDYDWAHLAYSIWPDHVREVCKHDRSIAIAHGLEGLCEVAVKPTKKKRVRKKQTEIEEPVLGDGE